MYLRVLILSLIVLLAAVGPASQRAQAQQPDLPDFPVVPDAPGEEGAPLPRDPWTPILIGSPASPGDVTRPLICVVCQPELVFYHSNSGGDWNIYRLTDDGLNTLANNVTRGRDSYNIQPSYSPENDWVAFTTNRDGNWEIYLAQPDGSQQVRLTHNSGSDVNPVWGPASLIAWESNRDGNWELYMADISGNGLPVRLTDDPANDINPYWVPEVGCYFRPVGGSLVFQSDRVHEDDEDGVHDWEIYLLDVATRELTQLTDNDTEDVVPVLSRDGKSLAWLQLSEAGVFDLWFMNLITGETRQLTDLGVDVAGHTFSPDGRSIAFHARMDGSYNVYLVDVVTGQVRALTDGADNNLAPSFRCDNRAVIFHSDAVVDETRPGQREVFEVRLAVTDAPAVRLTKDIEADDIYALADPREEINSKEGRMPPHPEAQP
jgi:TolB protein